MKPRGIDVHNVSRNKLLKTNNQRNWKTYWCFISP